MKKTPINYFQHNTKDYFSNPEFMIMTAQQRGLYLQMLFLLADNAGSIAYRPELYRIFNYESEEKFLEIWELIKDRFKIKNNKISCVLVTKELRRIDKKIQDLRNSGLKGAKKRWAADSNATGEDEPAAEKPQCRKIAIKESKTTKQNDTKTEETQTNETKSKDTENQSSESNLNHRENTGNEKTESISQPVNHSKPTDALPVEPASAPDSANTPGPTPPAMNNSQTSDEKPVSGSGSDSASDSTSDFNNCPSSFSVRSTGNPPEQKDSRPNAAPIQSGDDSLSQAAKNFLANHPELACKTSYAGRTDELTSQQAESEYIEEIEQKPQKNAPTPAQQTVPLTDEQKKSLQLEQKALLFIDKLRGILPVKTSSDLTFQKRLCNWLKAGCIESKFSDEIFERALDIARQSLSGQNPPALFTYNLRQELGYNPRVECSV